MRTLFSLFCSVLAAYAAFSSPIRDNSAARYTSFPTENEIVPVEYLQGDGYSWLFIPQEILKDPFYAPTVELMFIAPCKTINSAVFHMYYGSRGYCIGRNSGIKRFQARFGNATAYSRESGFEDVHTIEICPSMRYVIEDGVEFTIGANPLNEQIDGFVLFARYNSHTKVVDGINDATIFRMRIYNPEKSVLLYDLQPVRIGNKGFMLDTVSGELFANQGTGSFILGPDIAPLEY